MRLFDLIAVFIVMAAGFGYLNFRLLKLPTTIGLMALSLLFSLSLFVLGAFVPAVAQQTRSVIEQFDFNQVLLHGMLAFLLFAGALHIDLGDLARHKEPIALLATVGVLLSTLIVGVLMWGVGCLRPPWFQATIHRLPALRGTDLAYRPHRRAQPAQEDRCPQDPGGADCWRVAVQRRDRRRPFHGAAGGRYWRKRL